MGRNPQHWKLRRQLGIGLAVVGLAFGALSLTSLAFADQGGTPNENAADDGVVGSEGSGSGADCHGANVAACREDPQPTRGNDCVMSDDHVCTPATSPSPTVSPSIPPDVETPAPSVAPPVETTGGGTSGGGIGGNESKPHAGGNAGKDRALAFTGPLDDIKRNGLIGLNLLLAGIALLKWTSRKTLRNVVGR
jgi:hypothetical protein